MSTLNDLLEIGGVAGAFEFSLDGKLVDCKTRTEDLSPEEAAMSASFCDTVRMLFNTPTDGLLQRHESAESLQDGWDEVFARWVVVTGGNHGVFARGARASVQQLIDAVVSSPAGSSGGDGA